MFFRMHRLSDIYFVGGFGTVQWVDVAEYVAATPDEIVRSQPHQALQVTIHRLPWLYPTLVISRGAHCFTAPYLETGLFPGGAECSKVHMRRC